MNDGVNSVLKDNFAWLEQDAASSRVLYRSALSDLAESLKSHGNLPSPSEAKAVFDDISCGDVRLFAEFCSILTKDAKKGEERGKKFIPKRVSYLRSQMTDKAFSFFSGTDSTMSAVYGADFKSICEDVYYERSDACILPLESSADGLLMSFRNLLLKYELWIYDICELKQNDDSLLTMALLTASAVDNGDVCELYFPSSAAATVEDISAVIRTLGGNILRVSTVKSEYIAQSDIHICVKVPEYNKFALGYCLDALYPSHMILGNYSNFNNGKE